jgi:hypothetical protein
METLVHRLNCDNKYAIELHLQNRGSDKDWGEQSKKIKNNKHNELQVNIHTCICFNPI